MTRFTHVVVKHKRRVSRDTEEPAAWPVVPRPRAELDSSVAELVEDIAEVLDGLPD